MFLVHCGALVLRIRSAIANDRPMIWWGLKVYRWNPYSKVCPRANRPKCLLLTHISCYRIGRAVVVMMLSWGAPVADVSWHVDQHGRHLRRSLAAPSPHIASHTRLQLPYVAATDVKKRSRKVKEKFSKRCTKSWPIIGSISCLMPNAVGAVYPEL